MWSSLIPLIVGSALVPIQIVITTLLLRSASGKVTALAFVAGMTAVRLGQGLLFGLILGSNASTEDMSDGPGSAVSLLLLVLAILFYVSALKQILNHPDDDAPPPRWMAVIDGVTPGKALALGAGVILISAKFWVFTLGAIAVIGDAGMDRPASIVAFVVFVAAAESDPSCADHRGVCPAEPIGSHPGPPRGAPRHLQPPVDDRAGPRVRHVVPDQGARWTGSDLT